MGIYDNTPAAKSRKINRQENVIKGPQDFPVGLQERFSATFNSIRQRHTPRGNANVIGDKIAERNQIIADNDLLPDGQIVFTPIQADAASGFNRFTSFNVFGNPLGIPTRDQFDFEGRETTVISNAELAIRSVDDDKILAQLIIDNPDLGILSDNEIERIITDEQNEILLKDEDLQGRTNLAGTIGFIAGGFAATITDPFFAATSLASLPTGGTATIAAQALRVGLANAFINGATEIITKDPEVKFRNKFGEDISLAQATTETLFTTGGGFVLGGTLGGAIGIFRKLFGKSAAQGVANNPLPASKNNGNNVPTEAMQESLNKYHNIYKNTVMPDRNPMFKQSGISAEGTVFDPQVQQAARLLQENLDVARSAPNNTNYEAHMARYSETRLQVAEKGSVTLDPSETAPFIEQSNLLVEPQLRSQMAIPGVTVEAENVAAATLRNTLRDKDIFINEAGRNPSDPTVQTSTRARLEQLDSNEASIRATLDCLG